MKKFFKIALLCMVFMTLFACSNKTDYDAMKKELETQGFKITLKESTNSMVELNKNYSPAFNFGIREGKVSIILFADVDFAANSITGVVYLNDKEIEKDVKITKDAQKHYKDILKDFTYSEDELVGFAEWYYNENKAK